ncbi:uncharacterized protein PRCAT00005951001 [Priceomyces carsonii]|uniref:uncharacterized protein n=1 Tax=Priceomyces carsonii TaxID=28549 RepID=UPI002ED8FE98|nr:unnamed protein product [Priceomyces carsonii]
MSKALCCWAFECLLNRLVPDSDPVTFSTYFKKLNESVSDLPLKSPLFVTWNKNHDLRGCIGTFRSLPLESGTKQFALTAALQDTRFSPIKTSELESLEASITLLDDFRKIETCTDWQIGKHGLQLSFTYDEEYFSGTFLPQVAEEQKWDKVTTLYYLLKKADFRGVGLKAVVEFYNKGLREGWLDLQRYDGLKESCSYDEFMKIRHSIKD